MTNSSAKKNTIVATVTKTVLTIELMVWIIVRSFRDEYSFLTDFSRLLI